MKNVDNHFNHRNSAKNKFEKSVKHSNLQRQTSNYISFTAGVNKNINGTHQPPRPFQHVQPMININRFIYIKTI